MRNSRARSLFLLVPLFLPVSSAALTPVGPTVPVKVQTPCSSISELTVVSSPAGEFEVVWVDDWEFDVRSRLFPADLTLPVEAPEIVLPMHGGQVAFDLVGTWTGEYDLALNVVDNGVNPSVPWEAFRAQLEADGDLAASPVRIKTRRFRELAPAADGDSLEFRWEPPIFGRTCGSRGLLARRLDESGVPISGTSRVTRRASAWSGTGIEVERLPNDTFLTAYRTCDRFDGLVVRRLNANGAPLGNPIHFKLPGVEAGFGVGGSQVLAARGRSFLAVALSYISPPGITNVHAMGVAGGNRTFGPTRITAPHIDRVFDLAASPAGGYLLLYGASVGDPAHLALFAVELDARGVALDAPVRLTGDEFIGVNGAVASLPGNRWVVVTRAQQGDFGVCEERLMAQIFQSGS